MGLAKLKDLDTGKTIKCFGSVALGVNYIQSKNLSRERKIPLNWVLLDENGCPRKSSDMKDTIYRSPSK